MRFSDETLEKVREACDIVEIVGEHVTLRKSGQNFKGLCPFHSERTPSFVVSPSKEVFHCFGCGAGGNVFTFVMQVENLSFVEAVRSLAKRKGIELPVERSETDSLTQSLLSATEFAVSFYKQQLAAPPGKKAREYLKSRALNEGELQEFALGYAPPGWDNLLNAARKHFSEGILLQAGLLVARESGSGAYDRFRDRLMFPILGTGGKPIGFGGRALDGSESKYMNSSDSPVFQKGSILYGLYQSKQEIRAKESAIVVEGYTDLLSLFTNGFKNVVASCGTAFTDAQAKLLRRYTQDAILIYDGDEAGIRAARRTLQVFVQAGLRIRIVCLPGGSDPDSFIREQGAEAFGRAVESSCSVVEFVVKTSPEKMNREAVLRSLIEVFTLIDDSIYRRLQVQESAEALRFDENTISYEVERLRKKGTIKGEPTEFGVAGIGSVEKVDRVERELMKLILEDDAVLKAARSSLNEQYLSSSLCRQAFDVLKNAGGRKRAKPAELLGSIENVDVRNFVSSILLEEGFEFEEPMAVFTDYLRKLKQRWLKESIRSLEEEIRKKEKANESKELQSLFAKLQALAAERSALDGGRQKPSENSIQPRRENSQ
ncbi:MAG: DNA primase [Candidatus Eisenbacteria bacterium]|nr:DNA primase [Candidatus Eisenbacteria bacterium]